MSSTTRSLQHWRALTATSMKLYFGRHIGDFHFLIITMELYRTGPLPDELTHIVLESKVITDAQLIKKLNCDSISPKMFIVQTNWLIDSVAKSSRLDEAPYRIDPKINDSVTNDSARKTSSSSSNSGSKEISNKRQKTSGGDSEVPTSSTDKHPIITNPIYHPSLSPTYGSWQEQGSIMYKLSDPSDSIRDSSTSDSVGKAAVMSSRRENLIVAVYSTLLLHADDVTHQIC